MRSIPHGLVLLLFVACSNDVTAPKTYVAQEPFAISLAASGVSRLSLTGINGNTTVTGGARGDSVFISGIRQVGSRESQADATTRLQDLQVQFGLQGDTIVVKTVQPADQEGRDYTVNYEVTLPKTFPVALTTANGDIVVSDLENTVTANIVNGNTTLTAIVGSVFAGAANGTILCDATLPLNGTLDLGVANGEIALTIPTTTSAVFEATVANGDILLVNLDLQDVNRTSTRVTGRLGSGQGLIDLGLGNGTITATGVAP